VRRPTSALALAVLALVPAGAHADETDLEAEPATGVTVKRVDAELDGAIARFRVRVRLVGAAAGDRLPMPPRGLVTAAVVTAGDAQHELVLTAAATAAERVEAIRQGEASGEATSVVHVFEEMGGVAIETELPRRATLDLELTIEAPTCFLRDERHVSIPAEWTPRLDATTRRRVQPPPDNRTIAHDGVTAHCAAASDWTGDETTWLAFPAPELARRPPGDDRIGARGGRFASGALEAARMELAIATTMSAIPDDLATVFVVDGSRSVTTGQLELQRDVIASYLDHAPRSAVQLVAFDRAARALLADWTHARAARSTLATVVGELEPRNGSDLDAGIAEAARWLAGKRGTRRIVVFTDELYPKRVAALDPTRLTTALPDGTTVHVVGLSGDGALARDDDAFLAPLAGATLGIAMTTGGDTITDRGDIVALDALALVRPVSLDHVRVTAPGFAVQPTAVTTGAMCAVEAGAEDTPVSLREGEACTWWGLGAATVESITVEGLVWGRRWREVVALGDARSHDVARELWSALAEPETREERDLFVAAADGARAMNERWSFLATWGGAGGYRTAVGGGSSGGGGVCGCEGPGMIGHGSYGTVGRVVTEPFAEQVRAAAAVCRDDATRDATITIALETTEHEIVGVGVTIADGRGAAATTLRACVEAAMWALPAYLEKVEEHATWSFTLAP
jgi:hypothetical protein